MYNQNYNQYNQNYNQNCNQNQNYNIPRHVHEVTGSTAVVQECDDCHNHRFATMSGDAIRMGNTHVHEVKFRTDYSDDHQHEYCGKTGGAVDVGNGKHVHYINDTTEREDGHRHQFQASTAIHSPTDCGK